MLTIPKQVSATIKAHAEAQHAIASTLSDKLNERIEELTRLNMDVIKATLAESMVFAKELMDAKNSQDFFSISASHNQREMQSATYYANEAMRIASATKDACNKAMAKNIAEASRHGSGLLTELTKNIPSTAEQVVDIVKSTWQSSSDAILKTVNERPETPDKQQQKDASTPTSSSQAGRKNNADQTARTTH
ncbi:phasin family protein [Glaciimonas sp. GNP009]